MMINQNNHYICPRPSKFKTMKYRLSYLVALIAITSLAASCKKSGSKSSGGYAVDKGQLIGVAPASKWSLPKPPGMVYIPPGTFHMGSSDEDMTYALTARNKAVSISGFWMDATEITNNEYRQFVAWVRDSITASELKFLKQEEKIREQDKKRKQDQKIKELEEKNKILEIRNRTKKEEN